MHLGPRYEWIRDLGSGGTGRVFLARDLHLNQEVALKLLHAPPRSARDLERLRREFALLARIEHPGVARAHDFGWLGDLPFFTTEYIAGEPLAAKGMASPSELLPLARDLAAAVAFLHGGEVLHLDLKPGNIISPADRSRGRAVLIDFGLFRGGLSSPPSGSIRGSIPFMAPECFTGFPGPPADVYALGVTLYWIATGAFPRSGASLEGPRLDDEEAWEPAPRAPSRARPELPPELDGIILKCLALDPRARYPSARELFETMERVLGRAPGAHARAAAPLPYTAGRDTEITRIEAFLDGIERGDSPSVLIVTGPPGAGQSHLLRELKVRAQTRGFRSTLEVGFPGRSRRPGSILARLGDHMDPPAGPARARWERFLAHVRRPRPPTRTETSEGERRLRRAIEIARAAGRVHRPFVLATDGLEHWDEVSITLLVDLVRFLKDAPPSERPPIGIAAGYREEGPSRGILRELTEQILGMGRGRGHVMTLGPLGVEDTLALHGRLAGPGEGPRGLAVFQATGGWPGGIVSLAAAERRGLPFEEPDTTSRAESRWQAEGKDLGSDERLVLLSLDVFGRPAREKEICGAAGTTRRSVDDALERLRERGLAGRTCGGPGEDGWMIEPAARAIIGEATAAERRRLHARIGNLLLGRLRPREGEALVEAARHFISSGRSREIVRWGLRAARYLKSDARNRAALEILRAVLASLGPEATDRRVEIALEIADLNARAGDLDEGIRLLREMLAPARRLRAPARARTLLRLATLHSRKGDCRRANALFREGFEAAGGLPKPAREARAGHAGAGAGLSREETLYFLNEEAAMKTVLGEHARAMEICETGLRLATGGRSIALRDAALNLHATRANLALRRFDFEGATRDLETSLEMAEAIGSAGNQATILNNLGVVHLQEDRYGEALRSFREAERTCLRIDEGPSLASIYGNLAVLHAKMGDFDSMERALDEGDRLAPSLIGRRQRFFLEHARGLGLLQRGRFSDARPHLETAVRLGSEIGDLHVTAYDGIYRAECLIFEGLYAEAEAGLAAASDASSPPRVRAMARARRAFLLALTGKEDASRAETDAVAETAGRPVPFLDAWDALFHGWASSLAGRRELAMEHLSRAARFFRTKGLRPAQALTLFIEAEALLLSGEPAGAAALLRGQALPSRRGERGDLAGALLPLLEARLVAGSGGREDRARAADLLAEAAAALTGNRLPEWSSRLSALRAALRPGEDGPPAAGERRALAAGLDPGLRARYLESAHWRAWTEPGASAMPGRPSPRGTRRAPDPAPAPGTGTADLGPAPGPARGLLVARSPKMRAVAHAIEKLRGSELPILIRGETGSGKELIARILHEESPRRGGELRIIDCATLPEPLLEAELFGSRAGSFTGSVEARGGILSLARGGTVLVDEIGGASPGIQAKLLRVVSGGMYRPIGSDTEERADVRFLFSTARDLDHEAREGRFRKDLLHRIRVIAIDVPPLRERPEDLPELVSVCLARGGGTPPRLAPGVMESLRDRSWPGNVRELENLIARLRIQSPGEIRAESVGLALAEPRTSTLFPRNLLAREDLVDLHERLERDYINYHHARLGGDTAALCRFLGLGRRQLYRRCERLGIRLRKR